MVPIFRPCSAGELHQFGQAGHGAVVVHDFADDRGGLQSGHASQVAAGFGVAGADQHAFAGGDREDVAGLHDVVGGVLGHGDLDGARAVGGGNAGGDAFGGFDGDGEGGAELVPLFAPSGQAELLAALFGQGQADQAAACLAMKLMASGVMCSAAMTRSPSFSRSSSSTRMTMRPALSSATISAVLAMVGWGAWGNPGTAKGVIFAETAPAHDFSEVGRGFQGR
jgi:hypothetical protein